MLWALLLLGVVSATSPPRPDPYNPPRCGLHEHFEKCPPNCPPQNCSSLYSRYDCSNASKKCIPQCRCDDGYLRDKNGWCRTIDECLNKQTCGVNEKASDCKIICPPQTCESLYTSYSCLQPQPCVPGCDCISGYLRDKDDRCIPSEKCPPGPPSPPTPECEENKEYKECGPVHPDTCDSIKNGYNDDGDDCVEGCFCIDGYVENENRKCIPIKKCPAEPKCLKENEVYNECGSACPDTCDDYQDEDRICTQQCVKGCFCAKGYVRSGDGRCVKPKNCPTKPVCQKENEVYNECGSACPDTCDNYQDEDRICTDQCVKGCFCAKGYVKSGDGRCVKPEECLPPTPVCKANEEYKTCGTACPDTCLNYKDTSRVCTKNCVIGCFCKKGFVKNGDGKCVEPDKCPVPKCPKNEIYVDCVLGQCNAKTCEDLGFPIECPRIAGPCKGGCVCQNDMVRNRGGICILKSKCPSCGGDKKKVSGCGNPCGKTCSDYQTKGKACPLYCEVNGCDCKEGYVLNGKECVKPKDCPKNPTCGDNEVWKPCRTLCPPQTCMSKYVFYKCTAPQPCEAGCDCKPGYLRYKEKCILSENCPPIPESKPAHSCGGDPRKVPGCGNPCRKTCSDYQQKDKACPLYCLVDGCDCKEGYVLDGDNCVKPKDCPNSDDVNYY